MAANMDIALIFAAASSAKTIVGSAKTAVGLAQSVAHLFGVVNSLEAKVDRIAETDLNSGLLNLELACNSEGEQLSLLREGRARFIDALAKETGHRRGIALLGLATCHHHLQDESNCRAALEELVSMPPPLQESAVLAAALRRTHGPMSPYDAMSRFSSRRATAAVDQQRIDYEKAVVMSALNRSPDAKRLLTLQEAVSKFIGKPVKWREDLDRGQFEPST